MGLVLETVDDAVRSDGQHGGSTDLLDRCVAEHCLDGLVPRLDVLLVRDDVEEDPSGLLVEEDVLGSLTLLQRRVLDRLAHRDARVPSDLRTLILEPVEEGTSDSVDEARLRGLVLLVDFLLQVPDVNLG